MRSSCWIWSNLDEDIDQCDVYSVMLTYATPLWTYHSALYWWAVIVNNNEIYTVSCILTCLLSTQLFGPPPSSLCCESAPTLDINHLVDPKGSCSWRLKNTNVYMNEFRWALIQHGWCRISPSIGWERLSKKVNPHHGIQVLGNPWSSLAPGGSGGEEHPVQVCSLGHINMSMRKTALFPVHAPQLIPEQVRTWQLQLLPILVLLLLKVWYTWS